MPDNLEPQPEETKIIKFNPPQSGNSAILAKQGNLDLHNVRENIIERIKNADNSELPELIKILDNLQPQIDREIAEKLALAKLEAIQKQTAVQEKQAILKINNLQQETNLARKIEVTNITFKFVGSGIGCFIGLYLILIGNPFVGPLILILSLATYLNIPINDITNLISQINQVPKESEKNLLDISEKKQNNQNNQQKE